MDEQLKLESKLFSINLDDLILQIGEDRAKGILSSFECPLNTDVKSFIRYKAIQFSKQGIARTHLVYWYGNSEEWGEQKAFVGYYSIAPKSLIVCRSAVSKKQWQRVIRFGNGAPKDNKCEISAPLIDQLGKNFADGNNLLLSGSELLGLALNKIKLVKMK